MYEKERGTTVYSGRSPTWTGKIALAYPSDYGYATDLSKCSQTLYNYNDSTCKSNDWMYSVITNSGRNAGWLLTPGSGYADSAFYVSWTGTVFNRNSIYFTDEVAPALYLGSDQDIVSGDGSQSNPYKLANS